MISFFNSSSIISDFVITNSLSLSNNSELQIINGISNIGFFNPETDVSIRNISFLVNNVSEYYENNLFTLAGNLSCDRLSRDFSIPIEVNYGNLMIPFDQWFGTYHDGSEELHNQMIKRLK